VAALIEQHQAFLIFDKENWDLVAYGTWWPDQTRKISAFQPKKVRYVRVSAPAPKGIAIADIRLYETEFIPPNASLRAWGPTIDFPLIPVAGAIDANSGEAVAWSSWGYNIFTGGKGGKTQTATRNGESQLVTRRAITNTQHDMFCPGLSIDANGNFVVSGGQDARATSIYNTTVYDWFRAGHLNVFRGYQSSTTLSDGRIFLIGGSWQGGVGIKNGEVYDAKANAWTEIDGADVKKIYTQDQRTYRQDNHPWLFGWTNGSVFQAGPSVQMNWFGT
jgi:galactose oxidase